MQYAGVASHLDLLKGLITINRLKVQLGFYYLRKQGINSGQRFYADDGADMRMWVYMFQHIEPVGVGGRLLLGKQGSTAAQGHTLDGEAMYSRRPFITLGGQSPAYKLKRGLLVC